MKLLQRIAEKLISPENESLKMSLDNVHADGLFSLVVDGLEPGRLLRIFLAHKELKPFGVQLHTHRYPINLTLINGDLKQYAAVEIATPGVKLSKFEYRSILNGGSGLQYISENYFHLNEFSVPVGGMLEMDTKEFHTVSCSKGSIWVVEENGFETDHSLVLGVPFNTDSLYRTPTDHQISFNVKIVQEVISKILASYEQVQSTKA